MSWPVNLAVTPPLRTLDMSETRIGLDIFRQQLQGKAAQRADGGRCAESEPFALQVTDDSMEPEFAQGCIIVIDPAGLIKEGCYVLARDHNHEYIFRQLHIHNDRYILRALNEHYAAIDISSLDRIEGVITQRAGKRRSYHKRYN